MKKDNYFGSTEIKIHDSGIKSLIVSDVCGNSEITISDGEIRDRNDSMPVAVFTITEDEKEKTLLIHKVDCLALATFLLNIHNEYAEEQNTIRLQEQQKILNLNNKISTSKELNT